MAKKVEIEKQEVKPIEVESPLRGGMSDTMKGMLIGILVTALIAGMIFLLVLGENKGDSGKAKYATSSEEYSDALNEFYKYFTAKEKKLIVFASSQCSYCVAQEPIVNAIATEYGLDYLYMDYLNLKSEEVDQVIEELGIGGSTPTSVIVQDGKVLTSWVGYVPGEEYVNQLITAGMLPSSAKYDFEKNLTAIDYDKFKSLLKGSKTSAIIVDTPTCALCYTERLELNDLADKHDVPVYHLSADVMDEEATNDFIDGLGKWGYSTEEYKESQTVQVPLLLFVKKGKIVDFEVGYTEEKTNLEKLFKDAGIID